jgi:alpha-1,6-mannosyltransferase
MLNRGKVRISMFSLFGLNWKWGWGGLGLVGLHIWLSAISPRFSSQKELASVPIILLTGVLMLAGGFYLVATWSIRNAENNGKLFLWIVIIGMAMRASMFVSSPILENDYCRYLWDGGVTAHGFNPYAFSPDEVLNGKSEKGPLPARLIGLAHESEDLLSRINHPELRSIYPPVAQVSFALAHWLGPWKLWAWRVVLLALDLVTAILIIQLLLAMHLPAVWLVIYWWNPILTVEAVNSGHMDVVILPFLAAALLLTMRGKHFLAVLMLGLATGAKFWPVLLLPVILRPVLSHPRKLVPALGLFCLIALILFSPICRTGLGEDSGVTAYAENWEMNDALYLVVSWATGTVLKSIGMSSVDVDLISRSAVTVFLIAWVAWLVRKQFPNPLELSEACFWVATALFLLSPTQFPWYYLWLLPFLAVRPTNSLMLLTALLPLFYLRFYFLDIDKVGIFDYGVVWLEFGPTLILLAREWVVGRRLDRRKLTESLV